MGPASHGLAAGRPSRRSYGGTSMDWPRQRRSSGEEKGGPEGPSLKPSRNFDHCLLHSSQARRVWIIITTRCEHKPRSNRTSAWRESVLNVRYWPKADIEMIEGKRSLLAQSGHSEGAAGDLCPQSRWRRIVR